MKRRTLIRGVLVGAVAVAAAALSGGGIHPAWAGEINLLSTQAIGVAAPTISVPNEAVISAERTAGLCAGGICPLGGCKLEAGALSCSDAAQACHVSVGGTCIPPSTAASTGTSSADSTSSSPTCSASSCNGADPSDTGCSGDGVTNNEVFDGSDPAGDSVYTDNRWSQSCQANWARTWETGDYGQTLYATAVYADNSRQSSLSYYGNIMWSNMLDGSAGTQKVCANGTGSATSGTGDAGCF